MKTRLSLILLAWLVAATAHADTLTVSNANDSGPGSMREIVRNAAAGDIVVFEEALSGDTITLTSGQIRITVPITVDATSLSEKIILSGNKRSRIFYVEAEEPCLFKGIHFTKGRTRDNNEQGGAVYAHGSSFEDCVFMDNSTTGGNARAGAVYEGSFFTNCTFTGNSTTGDHADGGAVFVRYQDPNGTFTNCTFTNNSTAGYYASGGAVTGGDSFTNSTFIGNSTTGDYASGGAVTGGDSFVNCNFTNNSTAGFKAFGGAVSSGDSFINCNFTNNSTTGDEAPGGAVRRGGSFTHCAFTNNSTIGSDADGGAVSGGDSFTNCIFTNNSTAASFTHGGAVYSGASFRNCIFTNNSTTGSDAHGGAIYNPRQVYNCTILNNAVVGIGGSGGGVYIDLTDVNFLNCIIANNTVRSLRINVAGDITSLGGNVIGVTDGSRGWIATDRTGSRSSPLDPLLEADTCGDLEVFRPMAGSPALGIGVDGEYEHLCFDICGVRRFASCIDAGAVQVSACGGELAGRGSNADCAPTSVPPARKTAAVSFTAYPSPATGRVQLRGELPAGGSVDLTVVDAAGRRVLESSHPASAGPWETTLDLSALPVGVYAIVLQTAAGLQSVRVARQ